jgi:CRISPR/Cas system CMR-associated protein Cmr1 (group 7 of RAMP superfamily)
MKKTFKITFITPCFCRGADCSDEGATEIRPASIRGQLHWWFRALGGAPGEERDIFGGIHGNSPKASKVVVRVGMAGKPADFTSPTLPHKSGGHAAPKRAFKPGTSFDLLLSTRLGGLDPEREAALGRAVKAWLLLGALGLRATRGGGNFRWDGQPDTPEKFMLEANGVIKGAKLRVALLDKRYSSAEDSRRVVTDTLAEAVFGGGQPLGGIHPRKTSPLRFRIVQFGGGDFRVAAIWDGRGNVTGNTDDHLRRAISALAESNKEIGILLRKSSLGGN